MRIFEGIGFEYLINENEFSDEKDGLIKYKEKLNDFSGLKRSENNYFRAFVLKAYQSVVEHANKDLIYKMIFSIIKTKSKNKSSIDFLTKSKTLVEEANKLNISKEQASKNVKDVLLQKRILRASTKPEGFFKNTTTPPPAKVKKLKNIGDDNNSKQGSLTSVVTALLNLKNSPEKNLSSDFGGAINTSNNKGSSSSITDNNTLDSNNIENLSGEIGGDINTSNNKGSSTTTANKLDKKSFQKNLTTPPPNATTTLEENKLLFQYGGVEFMDSMGVMIDLTSSNDGLAAEQTKFIDLLNIFNAGQDFSHESIKNLIKEIKVLKIFKLFIKKPQNDNMFTTRGDGFCTVRMGFQLNYKHKKFTKYISFEDWRGMDPDINKNSAPLLDLIDITLDNMTELNESGIIDNHTLYVFNEKMNPVIDVLNSNKRYKSLPSKDYLDEGDLHYFVSDKSITYAIYQPLFQFEHITETDVGYNEFNAIISKLQKDDWLRMSFFKHNGEEFDTQYYGCIYDDLVSVATCGNNVYYYENNHFCWAGDFVEPYTSTDAPILTMFNTCVAKLLYNILIQYSGLIKNNINSDEIYNILDKEIIVETVVMSALEDIVLEKSEKTNVNEMKSFVDKLKKVQKENTELKLKMQMDEQKRQEYEEIKMQRKLARQNMQKAIEDEMNDLKLELAKKFEENNLITEELHKVKKEFDDLKSKKNLANKSPDQSPTKRKKGG